MNTPQKVAFYTLGCKLNFSETSTIARDFKKNGFEEVPFSQTADIYVINTCSVTENADKEFKRITKKALSKNSEAFLIAIGCYAQLQPQQLADVEGVDLVLGATEKFNIIHYLNNISKTQTVVHSCEIEDANHYHSSYAIGHRTRAFLKVQDGCDYKCTYCTIPLARGISRSDSLKNIITKAKEITEQGIKEIVLTGVNIGDYGKGEMGNKKHLHTFYDLLQELEQVSGLERVRISSIEPNLLSRDIIEFVAQSDIFVPHFHIPLQSGSDKILKTMKRRYLTDLYIDRVRTIKELMPEACIGVDVIVGFPSESEEDFMNTYNLIHLLDISYLHVFSYSERPNTLAYDMDEVVPKEIRHKRSKMLRGLSAKKRHHFYQQYLGQTRKVLFETENKDGYLHGFTDNYIRVKHPYEERLCNSVQSIQLYNIDTDGDVLGEIINKKTTANLSS